MSKAKTNQTYTYNGITLGNCTYNINDKDSMIRNMIAYMLNRTNGMFKYKNLPDTIPSRIMELYYKQTGISVLQKLTESFMPLLALSVEFQMFITCLHFI